MFVAVYRWTLKEGHEAAFRTGWERITRLAHAQCGSGGSALFRAADGDFVAIARWPDRAARAACFSKGSLDAEASALMKDAIARTHPEMELDAIADLWATRPQA